MGAQLSLSEDYFREYEWYVMHSRMSVLWLMKWVCCCLKVVLDSWRREGRCCFVDCFLWRVILCILDRWVHWFERGSNSLIWQISANFPGKILLFPTPISHSICISIETCYYVCYCYRTAYLFTWSEGDLKVISWNRILITSFDRTPPSYHIDNTISLKYLVLWEIQWCTFCV